MIPIIKAVTIITMDDNPIVCDTIKAAFLGNNIYRIRIEPIECLKKCCLLLFPIASLFYQAIRCSSIPCRTISLSIKAWLVIVQPLLFLL